MNNDEIDINIKVNLKDIRETIESALTLEDNQEIFNKLIEFERTKKKISDYLDLIKSIESDVKGIINSKANQLYTEKWECIKGENYKITKSMTGSVYNIDETEDVSEDFIIVKKSIDTKVVNQYIKDNGALPKGVKYNEQRGTSIRLTVHDNEDVQS